MGSWHERLMRFPSVHRQNDNFVLERTFVCGPHFTGKSRILQKICETDCDSNVSSLNYKSLVRNHDREYICNYLQRRIDNKVYEHSMLQLAVNALIKEYLGDAGFTDRELTDRQLQRFVERCREITPDLLSLDKNLIILIDTTTSFIRKFAEHLPSLRLQILAYLAIIPNFKNFAKIIVAYDHETEERDPLMERYGAYDMLRRYVTPLAHRNVRLVRPDQFDSTARLAILHMHKRETFDVDSLLA